MALGRESICSLSRHSALAERPYLSHASPRSRMPSIRNLPSRSPQTPHRLSISHRLQPSCDTEGDPASLKPRLRRWALSCTSTAVRCPSFVRFVCVRLSFLEWQLPTPEAAVHLHVRSSPFLPLFMLLRIGTRRSGFLPSLHRCRVSASRLRNRKVRPEPGRRGGLQTVSIAIRPCCSIVLRAVGRVGFKLTSIFNIKGFTSHPLSQDVKALRICYLVSLDRPRSL